MAARALIVAFNCKPDRVQDFVERASRHAALVRQEPGCLRCDVLKPDGDGNTVYLYELFASAEALAEHTKMPYMPGFVSDFQAMIVDRTRTECTLLN